MKTQSMVRAFMVAAVSAAAFTLSVAAFAQQGGTAQEARAMLDKAIAAVKADKTKAIDMFTKGEGGFLDRDLYPFCLNISDGKVLTTQVKSFIGQDARTLKDANGKMYGQELLAAGQKPEGQITEVSYEFPRPGTTTPPVPKVSLATKVGDVVCGVGYYK
jgi:hypothetical protein